MADLNKAQLIGRLSEDPKVQNQDDNKKMTRFTLATNSSYIAQDGEKKEKVQWHKIVAYGGLADVCAKYTKKGSEVYIEGPIETRQYPKDGQTHFITEIIVSNIQFLGKGN